MPVEKVVNPRMRQLVRKHIPVTENLVTLALMAVLIGLVAWVAAQRDNYDPATRDVAIEQLLQSPAGPELYDRPLQPWIEPGAPLASQTVSVAPYPESVADQRWRPTGRVKAFDADNLYEKINGEAPKFLRQGFQSMHYLVLKSATDGAEIAIELYDQGDMGGSMGVLAEHQSGGDTVIEEDGPVVFFRTSAGVIGRKGRFFFRAAGDSNAQAIRDKSLQLVAAFKELPETEGGADVPEELRILGDGLGVAPELIAFEKENVFQYDFVENFWFGKLDQAADLRVFIHIAASASDAAALFQLLLEEQSYDYAMVEQSETNALLRHEFLNNYFAIGRRGRYLFGVENAGDTDQIKSLLAQFAEALPDG